MSTVAERLSVPAQRQRSHSLRRRRRLTVLLFMSPWIIGFSAFIAYPMLASLYFSFTSYNLSGPAHWVGTSNYRLAFSGDPVFWKAVRNTVWMVCIAVPIKILFALGIAMLLVRVRRGSSIYRTVAYLPAIVPLVAAGLSFTYLLNSTGPLNRFLGFLHIPKPLWFTDPSWAKPGLALMMLWAAGNTMVILLSALLDVPRHLYEAAAIDGAGAVRQFRTVTIPLISPVLFFALLTGIIDGFQYFTQAYVIAKSISPDGVLGSPNNSTMFYGTWLYQQGYSYFNMGYAAALSWLLFLAIFVVTVVLIRTSRRWVYYSGG
jgi:multiple sugar transport system permease protein